MAQYNIQAQSERKNTTISGTHPKFPAQGEFATQADAQAQADKYATKLKTEDYDGGYDWVGVVTPV